MKKNKIKHGNSKTTKLISVVKNEITPTKERLI